METRYYEVAGHRFCVSGEEDVFTLMSNYEPFACADGETVFALDVENGDAPEYVEEMRQEDEGRLSADIRLQVKRSLNFIGGA